MYRTVSNSYQRIAVRPNVVDVLVWVVFALVSMIAPVKYNLRVNTGRRGFVRRHQHHQHHQRQHRRRKDLRRRPPPRYSACTSTNDAVRRWRKNHSLNVRSRLLQVIQAGYGHDERQSVDGSTVQLRRLPLTSSCSGRCYSYLFIVRCYKLN